MSERETTHRARLRAPVTGSTQGNETLHDYFGRCGNDVTHRQRPLNREVYA